MQLYSFQQIIQVQVALPTSLVLQQTSPEAIAASTATILEFCSGICPHKSRHEQLAVLIPVVREGSTIEKRDKFIARIIHIHSSTDSEPNHPISF